MVVTIYNKIHNGNNNYEKEKGKNKTNGMYLFKLVIKQDMWAA